MVLLLAGFVMTVTIDVAQFKVNIQINAVGTLLAPSGVVGLWGPVRYRLGLLYLSTLRFAGVSGQGLAAYWANFIF
jgi:hypothetical protein